MHNVDNSKIMVALKYFNCNDLAKSITDFFHIDKNYSFYSFRKYGIPENSKSFLKFSNLSKL